MDSVTWAETKAQCLARLAAQHVALGWPPAVVAERQRQAAQWFDEYPALCAKGWLLEYHVRVRAPIVFHAQPDVEDCE